MNKRIFERYVTFFTENLPARYTLHFIYNIMPLSMFVAYPALLVYAFFWQRGDFLKLVLVPLGVFVFVTVLRIIVNEERPYEKYGKPSVFNKQTKGKSFPSRHTASAFIIAMAFLYVNIPMGIAALFVALLIEMSRIFAGAHFVHDVVGGWLISTVAGTVFFFLL